MTNPPPTKSLPTTHPARPAAQQPSTDSGDGISQGGRQAVLSALPFTPVTADDTSTGGGRRPVAWLHITAPRGATPTAASVCDCGRNRTATGHSDVLALQKSHAVHRDVCPLRTTGTEWRAAA